MLRSGCRVLAPSVCLQLALLFGSATFGEDLPKPADKPGPQPPGQAAKPPKFVSPELSSVSEKTERIRMALRTQTELQFPDSTLREVCDYISQIQGFEVAIDDRSLFQLNRSGDDKVQFSAANVTLAQALTRLLRDDLDYVIDEDRLLITTADVASDRKETRLFGLQEFILTGMTTKDLAEAARQVADTDDGVVATGNILVVTLNQRSQDKILNLLLSLRSAVLKQTPAPAVEATTK